MTLRLPVTLLGSLLAISPVLAQRGLKDIPDPDPAKQQERLQIPDGWELNLFASDPMIAKPVHMNWDSEGRLWVVSSRMYPQVKPGQKEEDQVLVLEDTDGDGKADKRTVFADDLLIPTAVLPGDGGAYVANSTELLFLRDTNGDGKADERRVLLSGFGTEDTHHILHTFMRGPDGCVYVNQSVYIHTHLETPFGVRRLMGGGTWQFRAETGRAEIFMRGLVNHWGHQFDKWGQSFMTDGAGGEGINYVFPGFVGPTAFQGGGHIQDKRLMHGLNPGQPKLCSHEILSGRNIPDGWEGSIVANDFRGHRVSRYVITEDRSGYASRQVEDLVKSDHVAFRPIDTKHGPDGALYIADWYNPIIQHGEVDFRDERRDHVHGRIWRLRMKDRPLAPKWKLKGASVAELLAQLSAPEDLTREMAREEIRAKVFPVLPQWGTMKGNEAAAVIAEVAAWAASLDRSKPETQHLLLEALWTLQGCNHLHEPLLRELLNSPEPRARAAAVRSLWTWPEALPDALAILEKAAADDFGRVRLEAVHALRVQKSPKAVEIATRVLDKEMDTNLDYSLWVTCRDLKEIWLPAWQKGEVGFGGNVSHVLFALQAIEDASATGTLVDALKSGKVAGAARANVVKIAAGLGNEADLGRLFDIAADKATPPAETAAILTNLADAMRQRKVKPAGDLGRLAELLSRDGCWAAAARAAGVWNVESVRAALSAKFEGAQSAADRAATAEALLTFPEGRALVVNSAGSGATDADKAISIAALAAGSADEAAAIAAKVLPAVQDPAAAGVIFDSFLQTKTGPAALTKALEGAKLPAAIATAGVQKASAAAGDTKALIDALTKAGGIQPLNQSMTPEQLTALLAEVKTSGDPVRGEAIYRRQQLICTTCHAIGGAGGVVGPDMVSIGASAQPDYLVESLLNPSAKIKEGYHTTLITTKSGGVFSGFLVSQNERELILRDAAGKPQTIPAADVATREQSPVSLMPPGLTASLRRDEFVDLVRFLSELGKEGPWRVTGDGTVRRWRVLHYSDGLPRAVNEQGYRLFLKENPLLSWQPAYSLVSGVLPLDAVPSMKVWVNAMQVAQCEVDVTVAGKIGLRLADHSSMKLWVGENEVTPAAEVQVDAPAGRVKITVVCDPDARKAPVRLQVFDVPGSPARVSAVGGP